MDMDSNTESPNSIALQYDIIEKYCFIQAYNMGLDLQNFDFRTHHSMVLFIYNQL